MVYRNHACATRRAGGHACFALNVDNVAGHRSGYFQHSQMTTIQQRAGYGDVST
jgi:hypothetical protein